MLPLYGQIVLVTGATAGAGPRIARRFAAAGAWVGINFRRDLEGAKRLVDVIRSDGGRAMLLPGDVADDAQAWGVVERLDLSWGPPDVVVEQSGAEDCLAGCPLGREHWPPELRPAASLGLVRAALPRMAPARGRITPAGAPGSPGSAPRGALPPDRRIVLIGPADAGLGAVVAQVQALAGPIVVEGVIVAPGRSPGDVADVVLRPIRCGEMFDAR